MGIGGYGDDRGRAGRVALREGLLGEVFDVSARTRSTSRWTGSVGGLGLDRGGRAAAGLGEVGEGCGLSAWLLLVVGERLVRLRIEPIMPRLGDRISSGEATGGDDVVVVGVRSLALDVFEELGFGLGRAIGLEAPKVDIDGGRGRSLRSVVFLGDSGVGSVESLLLEL